MMPPQEWVGEAWETRHVLKKWRLGARDVAQQVKALSVKSDNLSLSPGPTQ